MYRYKDNLDIRVLQLGKWQVPKTKKLVVNDNNNFLSMGHFDLIGVKKVEFEEHIHPFLRAYKGSPRHCNESSNEKNFNYLEEYTIQELLIFTNIQENVFSKKRIEDFWNGNELLLFVSMIHIDNDSEIDKIIEKINQTFKNEKYLYYFSFDYSGIVLLVKGDVLHDFINLMFELNYQAKNEETKLVRDTYSFYGFNKKRLGDLFQKIKNTEEQIGKDKFKYEQLELDIDTTSFSVTINIGIQNYNVYLDFEKKIKHTGANIYGLLGRHDVSVVMEEASLKWLVYAQYLLNEAVNTDTFLYNWDFSTFETFAKIKNINAMQDSQGKRVNHIYTRAREDLKKSCDNFVQCLRRNGYLDNGQYELPIRAVQYSVLSILKNGFAEDFILCMYKPFIAFLDYLAEKCCDSDDNPENFDQCYNNFFMCINSLVNCAMHSERQFVQATAFNAIIYDVPAKIMAFYMAIIYNIQNIMKINKSEKQYTFLLTPSFSNEITVKIISYEKEKSMPHDRLLRVEINEKSLYNPPSVVRRMAHEIAHYAGDDLRNRIQRKYDIKKSLIYIILSHILHDSILYVIDFGKLVEEILNCLETRKSPLEDKSNYSEELFVLAEPIIYELIDNCEIRKKLREYVLASVKTIFLSDKRDFDTIKEIFKIYLKSLLDKNVGLGNDLEEAYWRNDHLVQERIQIITNFIIADIYEEIQFIYQERKALSGEPRLNSSIISHEKYSLLKKYSLNKCLGNIISIYSESFADIQMILLTNISYEDYLIAFVDTEQIEIEQFIKNFSDIGRASMVSMMMYCFGIWNDVDKETLSENEFVEKLHYAIKKNIRDVIMIMTDIELKVFFVDYRLVGGTYLKKISKKEESDKDVNQHEFNKEVFNVDGKPQELQAYMNLFLAEYLKKCIKDSIERYSEDDKKIKRIKRLREKMKSVIECSNIKHVFKVICNENHNYRKELFGEDEKDSAE